MRTETQEWLEENLVYAKGNFRLKGNRTDATLLNIAPKLLQLGLDMPTGVEWETWKAEIVELDTQARAEARNSAGKLHTSELEYVEAKMEEYGIVFTDSGAIRYDDGTGGIPARVSDVINRLKLDLAMHNRNRPLNENGEQMGPKLLSELITPSLEVKQANFAIDRLKALRSDLRFDPRNTLDLDQWGYDLLKIYGVDVDDRPQQIMVLKHMLWTIKRKIYGHMEIANPLMLVVYSHRGGVGKTKFLECLAKPFAWGYNKNGKLASIVEGNNYKAMIYGKYLIDFAELAISHTIRDKWGKLDTGAMNEIKNAFTASTAEERAMYTSTNEAIDQTAVFCSSSNIHVYDVFQDYSGMRRFYEIKFDPDNGGDKKEFWRAALPLFDQLVDVYKAIDENDDKGFYHVTQPFFHEIVAEQEAMSRIDSFGQYCRVAEVEVISAEEEGYAPITIEKLRSKFNEYLTKRGDTQWTMAHLLFVLSQKDMTPRLVTNAKGKIEEVFYIRTTKGDNL